MTPTFEVVNGEVTAEELAALTASILSLRPSSAALTATQPTSWRQPNSWKTAVSFRAHRPLAQPRRAGSQRKTASCCAEWR
ncbi:MAG: hypothetical protein FWD29_01095 [Micrococcales bacterium]|nr:hypothetical protein [Micrococcales bacterium]